MLDNDDSFIQDYLAESREHLSDIETDLLAIEAAGESIDEQLVNKVFRAAHSIKGGAGFFNLSKIQELGHKTENVLDLIRSREMVPAADVINILLMSFDRLREMINNPAESQQADITELVVALTGLVSVHLPAAQKASLTKVVKVTAPGVKVIFSVPEFDYNRAKEGGRYLYLVEYDLIDDVQRRGKRPTDTERKKTRQPLTEHERPATVCTSIAHQGCCDAAKPGRNGGAPAPARCPRPGER